MREGAGKERRARLRGGGVGGGSEKLGREEGGGEGWYSKLHSAKKNNNKNLSFPLQCILLFPGAESLAKVSATQTS